MLVKYCPKCGKKNSYTIVEPKSCSSCGALMNFAGSNLAKSASLVQSPKRVVAKVADSDTDEGDEYDDPEAVDLPVVKKAGLIISLDKSGNGRKGTLGSFMPSDDSEAKTATAKKPKNKRGRPPKIN